MAEATRRPSDSIEVKLQVPRHWKLFLETLAHGGVTHRSPNDVAVAFIGDGIRKALGAKDDVDVYHKAKELQNLAAAWKRSGGADTDDTDEDGGGRT